MTPGIFDIPFFQGATWNQTLEFIDEVTDLPYDLTGLGPFVMTIKDKDGNELASATGTGDYDNDGLVNFSIDSSVTINFPLGTVYVGIVDDNMEPYMVGAPKVLKFAYPPLP